MFQRAGTMAKKALLDTEFPDQQGPQHAASATMGEAGQSHWNGTTPQVVGTQAM